MSNEVVTEPSKIPDFVYGMLGAGLEYFFEKGCPKGSAVYVRATTKDGKKGFQIVINEGPALVSRLALHLAATSEQFRLVWDSIRADLLETTPGQVSIAFDAVDTGGSVVIAYEDLYQEFLTKRSKELN